MSDASEVKRPRIFHVNKDAYGSYQRAILVEDHDRIMSERDELWKRATKFVMPGEMDTGESIEHYIKTLEQTVAELRAEVERLKKLTEPVAMITESPFMVENITIDQRYKFEQTIARQAKVIENIKQALDNPATRSNEALVQIREAIEKGERA